MTRKRLSLASGVLLVTLLLARHWMGREPTEAEDQIHALSASGETVAAVARAERHNLGNTLTIAGEFKPFQDVDVHAKVAGYIKVIYVDVGDHVKQGQTIAILEVPELAAQLAGAEAAVRRAQEEIGRAQGDFERAKSTHAAMHSAYTRLSDAAKTRQGLVAQQELDDSQAKDLESQAQVSSAKAALAAAQQELEVARANQRQVSALSDYTRISALCGHRSAYCRGNFHQHAGYSCSAHRADFCPTSGAAHSRIRLGTNSPWRSRQGTRRGVESGHPGQSVTLRGIPGLADPHDGHGNRF